MIKKNVNNKLHLVLQYYHRKQFFMGHFIFYIFFNRQIVLTFLSFFFTWNGYQPRANKNKLKKIPPVARILLYSPSCRLVVVQRMQYSRVVLSPYQYSSRFSICCCTFFASITSSWSPFQVSMILWEKLLLLFYLSSKLLFAIFLCPLKYLASLSFHYYFFLSVSFRLFINS